VDEIHVTSEPDSRSAILRLDGALQTPIDGVLRSTVESLFQSGVRRVRLDLSGISSIDAAGVGELIQIFTAAAAVGGVLEIQPMSAHVRRVLEVTGVRWLLDVESPGICSTCR
jgi:anti-anti-sigma factor